jgi:hypothetical protein
MYDDMTEALVATSMAIIDVVGQAGEESDSPLSELLAGFPQTDSATFASANGL